MTTAHLAACSVLAGCALVLPAGGPALVVGYAVTDPTQGVTRRVVPGIDLDLSADTPGLRVGWSDLTVAVPADGSAIHAPAGDGPGFAAPLGLRWLGADGREHALGFFGMRQAASRPDQPLFVAQVLAGLSLEAAPGRAGLQLGLARLTWLSCPASDSAWLLVHADGRTCLTRLDLEHHDDR